MSRWNPAIGIAITLLTCTAARAEEVSVDSGVYLSRICKSGSFFGDGYCEGYIRGVVDQYISVNADERFCGIDLHSGASIGEVRDAVVKSLNARTIDPHMRSAAIIIQVLHDSFPCE
jgi:hypothetical protein